MKTWWLIVLLIGLPHSGVARLGDTEAELVRRYGSPVTRGRHLIGRKVLGPTLYFVHDDWGISCSLIDGRCARIRYISKVEWSEARIQSALENNRSGGVWSETTKSNPKVSRSWRRSDGATADWNRSLTGLTISSPD
jgi:hypothetical protein